MSAADDDEEEDEEEGEDDEGDQDLQASGNIDGRSDDTLSEPSYTSGDLAAKV